MVGSCLNDEYDIKTKPPYKLTTQLRTPKQSSSSEIDLMDTRSYPYRLKFHGKLETPADCVTKYDKEEFIQSVKEQVLYYGLQVFFAIPNADITMENLILNYRLFE